MAEAERCAIFVEVAFEKAMEACDDPEAVRQQFNRLFGEDPDDAPDCDDVLAGGITEETLNTMRGTRRYAMCRAWEIVQTEETTFSNAVNRAWSEVREAGMENGVEV